ncbi:hypothetical protein J2Y69_000881 [Microbacterium resistens]|uniref:Uncharacterized protein n=1 Tax=Microbacterium resistens TaxID=156977 RepID=A0ABU1S9L6_9MICO|nr:hypothetical protein [Microbacterium resistens]MDR6866289.1 hypothetical protein [Microbacterium resistens]
MRLTVRSVATILAIGFALYLAFRGLWWTVPPRVPWLLVASVLLFLAVIALTVIVGAGRRLRMPMPFAAIALAAGAVIPVLANLALDPAALRAPYATWYIGGVGLIGVICIVRRRSLLGWLVLVALTATTSVWIGMDGALDLGLVGSAVWMVIAQLLSAFWDRAVRDTDRLVGIQQAASAWHTTQAVRQRERRVRVQYALAVAGPVLSRVIESTGDLGQEERLEARLAEGRLRDEIRGANLLNEDARASIAAARRRGVTVTVFDEGGLDELDEDARDRIRAELAAVLRDADSARLIIRAARDAEIAVTVVGRTAAGESSDEDSVELWREIRRSARDPRAEKG